MLEKSKENYLLERRITKLSKHRYHNVENDIRFMNVNCGTFDKNIRRVDIHFAMIA